MYKKLHLIMHNECLSNNSFYILLKRKNITIMHLSSDRQVWANSADPDQTAPRGALIRVYTTGAV